MDIPKESQLPVKYQIELRGLRAAVLLLAFIAICLGIGYCGAVATIRDLESKQSGQVR